MSAGLSTIFSLVFVLNSCITVVAHATHQELDRVDIDGKKLYFLETPMSAYWSETNPMPKFDPDSTANGKAYTATWSVNDGKLYLASFTASLKGKRFDAAKMLGTSLPAKATWICGPLHAVDKIESSSVQRYSENANRTFFVDGVAKKTLMLKRVECGLGRVGVTFGNHDGFAVIERISAGSPAETSAQLEIGDIVDAFTDLDGERILIGEMEIQRAVQLIRGRDKQPLTLHVRKTATGENAVVKLERVSSFDGEFDRIRAAEEASIKEK